MDWTRYSAPFSTRARIYQRSAYDASYLELAQRLGLPFATKDEPLRKAAEELGVGIFQP
jgi:predicted nucleic acid-binding protein